MKRIKSLAGLSNVFLRASTLVFRFVLSFYIIKFLGIDASGVYGLALGLVGIVPALIGWGLNYFTSRDVVGQSPAFAGARVKSRLLVTTISLTLATIVALFAAPVFGYSINHFLVLVIIIAWLETFALDVHIPLIAQEMALQANVLVFVRSALWVPFVIALGLLYPMFRNIETVFVIWILSYVPAIAYLFYSIRTWPMAEIAKEPVHYDWIKDRLKNSWMIYVSDLSIVGLMYADRYIVNFMLGLTLTGIYTFFWSLTNALQTLTMTAVVQLALPILFKAYNNGSIAQWKYALRQQFAKTTVIATVMAIAVFIASEVLIQFMSMPQLKEHRGFFILMLLASVVRCSSDLLNVGLTSLKKDNHYATINMIGVCFAMANAFVMIALLGFVGTAIAALSSAVLMTLVRAFYLSVAVRELTGIEDRSPARS